jgi:hypothetical protein
MDRVTRNSASKNNTHTNDDFNGNPSPGKLPQSALVNASALIGNGVRTALPAPPSISSPAAVRQIASTLLDYGCLDGNPVENAVSQLVGKSVVDEIGVECLPNGKVHLLLPPTTNEYLLDNFVSIQSQNIDFSRVSGLSLMFCKKLTGAALLLLSQKFPALNNLDLTGCTQLNDSDLLHLANMLKLKNLSLAGCHGISKTGLVYLSNMLDNVEVLDLMNCPQVDDEIMACLPNMHQLKHLILTACTQFTNTGLRELRKLDKLESLILDQCTQISDAGLGNLHSSSKFRNLKEINLRYCPLITSKGVLALKKTLNTLKLVNTDVSLRKIAAAN